MSLNVMRYLTFEVGKECDLAKVHKLCPAGHPQRFRFGLKEQALTDDAIFNFWEWCRFGLDFRGIVMFSGYSEPKLQMPRIYGLMDRMLGADPGQPFRLITNKKPTQEMLKRFDMVRWSRYDRDAKLDNRIATIADGCDKGYADVAKVGWCGRKFGWELNIDYYGNVPLCCNDWRCEESAGNIFVDDWFELMERFEKKARAIVWDSEESYNRLPLMCRRCISVNPGMYMSGGA